MPLSDSRPSISGAIITKKVRYIKVQGVAFGPQPHDWLACQCSAIHALSALPGKKYILGIPHLRPCATLSDSRPIISSVIITKKVRYHWEKIGSTFPSSCISPTETLRQALLG